MDFGDNVVNLCRNHLDALWHPTVLTAIAGALPDQLF